MLAEHHSKNYACSLVAQYILDLINEETKTEIALSPGGLKLLETFATYESIDKSITVTFISQNSLVIISLDETSTRCYIFSPGLLFI